MVYTGTTTTLKVLNPQYCLKGIELRRRELLHVGVNWEIDEQKLLVQITHRLWSCKESRVTRKIEKQPTFDQYQIFEWAPGIPILEEMIGKEYELSDEENPKDEIVEEIVEDIYEE